MSDKLQFVAAPRQAKAYRTSNEQNRERYQPGHLFQVHTVATAPGSVFVYLPVSAAGLPIVAIAPIIAIHSSITNNEAVIIEIPMTTIANAVAP